MKFENTSVMNMDNAIRGMRNPLESWSKSDSYIEEVTVIKGLDIPYVESPTVKTREYFILGEADLILAKKLINGGSEHRKFLRQILVSVDVTAPLFWWKEFDTYKVGTTANSTSTMHRIMKNHFTLDMFEFDDFDGTETEKEQVLKMWLAMLNNLNFLRDMYMGTNNKFYWKELIRLLPSAWLQTRTVTMDYENLLSMYYHRRNHKLSEWSQYCEWIETLPYAQALFGIG